MLGDERFDVVFRNASAESGAGNFGQIDVVLFRDPPHQRAGAYAVAAVIRLLDFALLLTLHAFLLVTRKIGGEIVAHALLPAPPPGRLPLRRVRLLPRPCDPAARP